MEVKETGLGIVITTIFIAAHVSGGCVMMLPGAMVSAGLLSFVCIR